MVFTVLVDMDAVNVMAAYQSVVQACVLNCILLNDVLFNMLMIISTYFKNGVYDINALRE
jgi:hypothetical protein